MDAAACSVSELSFLDAGYPSWLLSREQGWECSLCSWGWVSDTLQSFLVGVSPSGNKGDAAATLILSPKQPPRCWLAAGHESPPLQTGGTLMGH